MTHRPDLNTLSKEVFEANKAKGFHDVEVSNETLLMLVITELSEAVEADRKGKRARIEAFSYAIKDCEDFDRPELKYKIEFDHLIKDTVEDELADAVIRLLDLAGLREKYIRDDYNHREYTESFPDSIYHIISELYRLPNLAMKINVSILNLEDLCVQMNIDLWQHVSLKLKYNQTRPIKHGKNY